MKNKLILLLVALCTLTVSYAQDIVTPSAAKETATLSLKNTEITIDNKVFDYRILKHYTEAELRNMPAEKRNQVYFIYTGSYSIKDNNNCSSVTVKDIDVSKLEVLRKDETTVSYYYYVSSCKVLVELMSGNMLKQQLETIK